LSREAEQEWLHLPEQSVDIVIRENITNVLMLQIAIVQKTVIGCYRGFLLFQKQVIVVS